MLSRLFSLIVIVLTLTACSRTESLRISGSSTVLPIISVAAEAFTKIHPNTSIIVNGGGSGVGINQLLEGRIDIGMISREVSAEERTFSNIPFIEHIIGRDAVVPVVSAEVYEAGITALSLSQISAIYTGEIQNWRSLGGTHREILVIDKESSRGTRHVFMQAVFSNKHAITAGSDLVLGSNNEEQTAITQSNAAIGMLSQAWINNEVKGLAILMPDGKKIQPSLNNIINGSYPISRNLTLITAGAPAGLSARFIDFILSKEGQDIVRQAGYIGFSREAHR